MNQMISKKSATVTLAVLFNIFRAVFCAAHSNDAESKFLLIVMIMWRRHQYNHQEKTFKGKNFKA